MLGKRVIGPRRVVVAISNDQGTIAVDPSVDVEHSDLQVYKDSLFELEHLKFLPGERPTYFTIQPLTRRQKDAAEALTPRARAAWYLRCSITGIENYQIVVNGAPQDVDQPERTQNGNLGMMVPEKWLDALDLPEQHLLALFIMIHTISEAQLPTSAASDKRSGAAA